MSNPIRYFVNNQYRCYPTNRHERFVGNQFSFKTFDPLPVDFKLERFDMYSAPDLIIYPISQKDEFQRYEQIIFLDTIKISESIEADDEYQRYAYTFEFDRYQYVHLFSDVERIVDVPVGILYKLNEEKAKEYLRLKSELCKVFSHKFKNFEIPPAFSLPTTP